MSRFGPFVPVVGGGGGGAGAEPAGAGGGPGSGGGRAGSGPAGQVQEIVAQVIAALAADPELIARAHAAADVDSSPQALHHTLGKGNTEAAPGSHDHDAAYALLGHTHDLDDITDLAMSWSNAVTSGTSTTGVETKDAGTVEFVAKAGRRYAFHYQARVSTSVASAVDLRVRGATYTVGVPVLTTSDLLLGSCSVTTPAAGGTGATTGHAIFYLECPGELAAGLWTVAGFWAQTGGGTANVSQSTGARRQLTVVELLQAD